MTKTEKYGIIYLRGDTMKKMKEVAEMCNVSYRTVFNWIKSGKLNAVKIGGSVRIPDEELAKFIKKR